MYRLFSLFPHSLLWDDCDYYKVNFVIRLSYRTLSKVLSLHEWKGAWLNPFRNAGASDKVMADVVELYALLASKKWITHVKGASFPPLPKALFSDSKRQEFVLAECTYVRGRHSGRGQKEARLPWRPVSQEKKEKKEMSISTDFVSDLFYNEAKQSWQFLHDLKNTTSDIARATQHYSALTKIVVKYLVSPIPARATISSALMMYRVISLFEEEATQSIRAHAAGVWRVCLEHNSSGCLLQLEDINGWFMVRISKKFTAKAGADAIQLLNCMTFKNFVIGYDGTVAGSVA